MVTVGRVGGAYGVQGWVRIVSYTDPPSNLLNYQPWHLRVQGLKAREARVREPRGQEPCWRPCPTLAVKPYRDGFVARFAEVADRDAAMQLAGAEIAVLEECLPTPDDGEFYWRDLIGLRVVDQHGVQLGVVEQLMPTGVHDVLVIQGGGEGGKEGGGEEGGGKEVLIPFVNAHVQAVRIRDGVMDVRWEEPQ